MAKIIYETASNDKLARDLILTATHLHLQKIKVKGSDAPAKLLSYISDSGCRDIATKPTNAKLADLTKALVLKVSPAWDGFETYSPSMLFKLVDASFKKVLPDYVDKDLTKALNSVKKWALLHGK